MMITMQHTNSVVIVHKVQTIQVQILMTCPVRNKRPPLLSTVVYNRLEMHTSVMLVMVTSPDFNQILID